MPALRASHHLRAWSPAFDYFERRVRIEPVGDAWRVEADGFEDVCFRTGGAAERHGRRVMQALAEAGYDATLEVLSRNGASVARLRCEALSEHAQRAEGRDRSAGARA